MGVLATLVLLLPGLTTGGVEALCAASSTTHAMSARVLPEDRLVIGYATSRSLRENTVPVALKDGVNVVIWSFCFLEHDLEGNAVVRPTFDVAEVAKLKKHGSVNLVAFGGWNGAHPDASRTGAEWFETWSAWNAAHGYLFDGVDWDLEGNDDADKLNVLEDDVADLVADFSVAAKKAGYIVGMAPAESYLDVFSKEQDNRLNHQPAVEWPADYPTFPGDFPYAGRNAYLRILQKAGLDAFDFVSVQLYEGFSRACYNTQIKGVPAATYIESLVRAMTTTGVGGVVIPPSKLVLGFANGWADGEKFIRVAPAEIADAFSGLRSTGQEPRGVMFWVIDEEGATPTGTDAPLFFARDLQEAFRKQQPSSSPHDYGEPL